MDNEILVKTIRNLCKSNNISVSQLEKELNFGAGLISRWTKTDPSLSKIVDIANFFKLPIDEVIGRKVPNKSEKSELFIDVLYHNTISNAIIWKNETDLVDQLVDDEDCCIDDDGYNYYDMYTSIINEAKIYLYSQYDKEKGKIIDIHIELYIQADSKSDLVIQEYDNAKLYDLWYYIQNKFFGKLDETKAEEFKNSFISSMSENNEKELNKSISKDSIEELDKMLSNPEVLSVMKTVNSQEFQKLQEVFSNPEFQTTMKLANRIQQYLSYVNKK